MKHLSFLCLIALCTTVSACQPRTPPNAQENSVDQPARHLAANATAQLGQASASATSTPGASLNGVHKGMAYADFRTALLSDGWKPLVDLKCKANVVGGAYKELCAEDSDSCKACDELPELSACSGDAVCMMRFQDAQTHRLLDVSTYGDIGDRNVHGADSQLAVSGWTASPSEPH